MKRNQDSEQISVNVYLKAVLKLRNLIRPFHFADLRIKNRGAQGNIITRHPVERVSRIMPTAKTGNETTEEESSALAARRNLRKAHPFRQKSPNRRMTLPLPRIHPQNRRWNRVPCLTPDTFKNTEGPLCRPFSACQGGASSVDMCASIHCAALAQW